MTKIEKSIIRELNRTRIKPKFLCNAPFTSMNITFPGVVTPCCYNNSWHNSWQDDYNSHSINEIWNGNLFNSYREKIKRNELPESCTHCENALRNKEFHSVKLHQYDGLKVSRIFRNKIRKLDISLSNVCNLECIMCVGSNCNRIRQNREHLPPIENIYGQKFRNELKPLLPDIQEIVFLGGEPFLNPLYYDIWEDIIEINPKCKLSIVTNGTILNDRIKSLLERGNFFINLSFDAMTKETYEAIRINAKFEETMANMKYFGDTLAQHGKCLNIHICPLKLNRFEIPDLIRFCNENKYSIHICVVTDAYNISFDYLSLNELKEIKDFYLSQNFIINDVVSKNNIEKFKDLIRRIDQRIEKKEEIEHFLETIDLGRDKIEDFRNIILKKSITGLKEMGYDEEKANALANTVMNRFENALFSMPDYFNSNHLYKNIADISPYSLAYYIKNGSTKYYESIQQLFFNK